MSIESMPKTVIWWGAGIAVAGALLIATGPRVVNLWWTPNTNEWEAAAILFETAMIMARALLAPLGAALVAAGIVMHYIDRRLAGETIADRPRRWRWPDDVGRANERN